jgi:glycosyltransferase involved in cell wall biosynthesis
MDRNLENLLKQAAAERQLSKAEEERTQRRKAFIEQLQQDLGGLANFDKSRAIRVGGGEITEDDVFESWARELCDVGHRIVKGGLVSLTAAHDPTGGKPQVIAIELVKLACGQKQDELEQFLRRAVAVDGLWLDVVPWIRQIAKILGGSAELPFSASGDAAPLELGAKRCEAIKESMVWTAPRADGFAISGTSGGGGGGGRGAGVHGQPGKPGESSPWHSYQTPLVPGQPYVFVIAAGGLGGREASPGQEGGEVGDAGGISYMSDGDSLLVFGATGASTELPDLPPPQIGSPTAARAPRFAIVDSTTRRVDNVIIARRSFFDHPLVRRVVLGMQLVERNGLFALEQREAEAIPLPVNPEERVAPGWLFLEDVRPDQHRFFLPAWPREPRRRIGAAGGQGGASRPDPDLSGTLRILAVATEWSSSKGGVSTINRELCMALAAIGHQVSCLVPPEAVDNDAQTDARNAGVRLVKATPTAGKGVGPYACLHRRPHVLADYSPHVVIGHGCFTGFAAQTLVQEHFHPAVLVHVIHTQPGEIEPYKDRDTDASTRAEISEKDEVILTRGASLVVGIGPRLKRQAETYLRPFAARPPIFELDPAINTTSGNPSRPSPSWDCLFLGRAEDEHLKGLDIAAEAVRRALNVAIELRLVVRGAVPGTGAGLRDQLLNRIKVINSVQVYNFSADKTDIQADFLRSTVVLMPSRSEGFGLVGLEAIGFGIPVLISEESGLAELLKRDAPEFAEAFVVPMALDDETNFREWGDRLSRVVADRKRAFERSANLRLALSQRNTWQISAKKLIDVIRNLSPSVTR